MTLPMVDVAATRRRRFDKRQRRCCPWIGSGRSREVGVLGGGKRCLGAVVDLRRDQHHFHRQAGSGYLAQQERRAAALAAPPPHLLPPDDNALFYHQRGGEALHQNQYRISASSFKVVAGVSTELNGLSFCCFLLLEVFFILCTFSVLKLSVVLTCLLLERGGASRVAVPHPLPLPSSLTSCDSTSGASVGGGARALEAFYLLRLWRASATPRSFIKLRRGKQCTRSKLRLS